MVKRWPHVAIAAMAALLMAADWKQSREKSDEQNLQGLWRAVSGQMEGTTLPPFSLTDMTVTFDEDRIQIAPDAATLIPSITTVGVPEQKPAMPDTSDSALQFHIDPSKKPKELTITTASSSGKGAVRHECVYSLENGVLTICWGAHRRPEKLATKAGDWCMLLVYKRSVSTKRFFALVDEWEQIPFDLYVVSNDHIVDPRAYYLEQRAYGELVRLGRPAVPFIMERYTNERFHLLPWEAVLDEITGLKMGEHQSRRSQEQARLRYLEWWEKEKDTYTP